MGIIEKINAALDKHFKSNKGNWQAEAYANPDMKDYVNISWDCRRNEGNIRPVHVALFILRSENEVNVVIYGTWIFTRSTLRGAGFKI